LDLGNWPWPKNSTDSIQSISNERSSFPWFMFIFLMFYFLAS
jgi:hypothetical protein